MGRGRWVSISSLTRKDCGDLMTQSVGLAVGMPGDGGGGPQQPLDVLADGNVAPIS